MESTLTILLVEDSPSDAGLLMQQMSILQEACVEVVWVETLEEALASCHKDSFDAVLTDLGLPDSSGIETIMRFMQACPNMPLVVLSGSADQSTAIEAVRRGVQDYFVKGEADGHLILRSIRYAIERKKKQRELDARTQELETILHVVSHDLRAPLINVRGFNSIIKETCNRLNTLLAGENLSLRAREKLKEFFESCIPEATHFIDASAAAMNQLVESLLKVARAGIAATKPETIDMDNLLASIKENLEFKFKDAGATVAIEPLPACFADRTQVTQVFTNLLDNAVKYLDPSRPGQIRLSGKVTGAHSTYRIDDNGIGIAAEHKDKIFEMFFRLGDRETGGEGIGLTIVKRMLERNGGRIWVESEKGKGSTFFVLLPTVVSGQ